MIPVHPPFNAPTPCCTLRKENYGSVLRDCSKALVANPQSVKAFYRSAMALVAVERFDEALDCCDRCLAFDPDNGGVKTVRERATKGKAEQEKKEAQRAQREKQEKEAKFRLAFALRVRHGGQRDRADRSDGACPYRNAISLPLRLHPPSNRTGRTSIQRTAQGRHSYSLSGSSTRSMAYRISSRSSTSTQRSATTSMRCSRPERHPRHLTLQGKRTRRAISLYMRPLVVSGYSRLEGTQRCTRCVRRRGGRKKKGTASK